jgi:hypothetical protein
MSIHSAGLIGRAPHKLLLHTLMPSPDSSSATSSVVRFLLPSVRDIIFIFLFWSILAGPLSNRPLSDADIGWHIRTGQQILATHTLPRTDPFSSTMQGQPWFAWEWLYDVALGIVYRAGGLNGVVWLCAALVAGVFVLLLSQLIQRGSGLLLAIVLMLLAEAASTIHLYARPHISSWLFSLLWFIALERWERINGGRSPHWLFWFFPASMLIWVNLHGGWIFGMALLTIYGFAAWVESVRAGDGFARIRAAKRGHAMAWAWMASVLATLANPYGWQLHLHIYRYLTDRYLMNHIDEFRSPDFHGWAQRCFAAILMLAVIALASRTVSGAQTTKLRFSHLLVLLLATYAGFYSSRNLPVSSMLLALIVGPILWQSIVSLGERPGAWRWLRAAAAGVSRFSDRMGEQEFQLTGHLWPIAAVVLAFAICLQEGWLGAHHLIDAKFDPKKVPAAAVSFLQHESLESKSRGDELMASPIFSTDAWGGYLIYRMYPERKVVLDDRHDLYGSVRVEQYLIASRGESGWREVLKEQDVQIALLPTDSTLTSLLREIPKEWRVAYEDKVAVVFQRRE